VGQGASAALKADASVRRVPRICVCWRAVRLRLRLRLRVLACRRAPAATAPGAFACDDEPPELANGG